MSRNQLTFRKKERAKKQQQKKREKQEKREFNKLHNNKGKGLEEMFAYVDQYGNISDTPPEPVQNSKNQDSKSRSDSYTDDFHFGKVSYYNESGRYGFIRDNSSSDTVYFNEKLAGMELRIGEKVKYKFTRSRQGNQVSEVELQH